jgi:hypothetical protein
MSSFCVPLIVSSLHFFFRFMFLSVVSLPSRPTALLLVSSTMVFLSSGRFYSVTLCVSPRCQSCPAIGESVYSTVVHLVAGIPTAAINYSSRYYLFYMVVVHVTLCSISSIHKTI